MKKSGLFSKFFISLMLLGNRIRFKNILLLIHIEINSDKQKDTININTPVIKLLGKSAHKMFMMNILNKYIPREFSPIVFNHLKLRCGNNANRSRKNVGTSKVLPIGTRISIICNMFITTNTTAPAYFI